MALRQTLRRPLETFSPSLPSSSIPALDRCLRRHGVSNLGTSSGAGRGLSLAEYVAALSAHPGIPGQPGQGTETTPG
jgi:hypothetical protein